jgi:hypothetical protein
MRRPGKKKTRQTIGWREWVGLPELGVAAIKAKIDTGARTSALHAWNIVEHDGPDGPWVSFELHPVQRNNKMIVPSRAPVHSSRDIRSSNGQIEHRVIIRTLLRLGERTWPIELSLTNRDAMGFRLLLGRAALRKKVMINPGRSFLIPRPPHFKT